MKKNTKLLLLLSVWLIGLPLLTKAGILDIQEAETLETQKQYYPALQLLLKTAPNQQTTEVRHRIARLYAKIDDKRNAERWYRRIIRDKSVNIEALKEYGDVLLFNGKYEEARQAYLMYQQRSDKKEQAMVLMIRCDSAKAMSLRAPIYTVTNENRLNTVQSEFGLSNVGEFVYFASDRPTVLTSGSLAVIEDDSDSKPRKGNTKQTNIKQSAKPGDGTGEKDKYAGTGRFYLNIFSAQRLQRDGAKERTSEFFWGDVISLPTPLNQTYHTGPCTFTSDGSRIIYAYSSLDDNLKSPSEKKKTDVAYVGLMTSVKSGSQWTQPIPFEYNNTTQYSVGDPFLSPDGKTLYFASDMPGGVGGVDLYMCESVGGNKWGQPVNLGPTINTVGNERFPTVAKDGTLYFSSDGHVGLGGLDIFRAEGTKGRWTKVSNLLSPINSSSDDFSMIFFAEGKEGLLCSNREGGVGADDIYYFKEIPPPPKEVFLDCNVFLGLVTNKKTNAVIPGANITITDVKAKTMQLVTCDQNGKFIACLKPAVNYTISASAEGYLYMSISDVILPNIKKDTTKLPMRMEVIEKNKVYNLDNINYAFGKATLQNSSYKALDILVDFLSSNPKLCIEIASHTDSKGNPKINTELSKARAESCKQYLLTKGVNPTRLKTVGYGSKYPKIKNAKTERQHAQNRRTEFKVIDCK